MADGMDGGDGRIAIVGMAGRFPGARDLGEFWRNLRDGVESVRFLSREEMESAGVPAAMAADPAWVPAVALPDGIDEFDAPFFGVSHREAEILDPQHRLFLEACWAALEDAGHAPGTGGELVAVYGGATTSTYLLFNLARNRQVLETVDPLQLIVGNAVDSLTTRVSYKLGLKGASHAVQCACSSSLVAVHLACQALLDQECDVALAGGVSINVGQRGGYRFQEDSILSPDGHCRAFDAAASGTVFGGGVGIVVLKRLADALADRDPVRAVILGSAVNNDGTGKVGYTAPSVEGQAEVVAEALSVAGIGVETIGYIEGHGTGTALGDPIEIQALTKAFRSLTARKGFAAIGTVKSNIGHLDIAAGVAGLIKTVLMLEHRQIPPSLHFERPNPRIDFASGPVYVNRSLTEWAGPGPRRAGVSSFGFGGTNAHVVLEEAPALPDDVSSRPWQLLVLSAKTEEALAAATRDLGVFFREHPQTNLRDAAFTLLTGRQAFRFRRIAVCRDAADAAACLESLDPARVLTAVEPEEERERPVPAAASLPRPQETGVGYTDLVEAGRLWLAGHRLDAAELFAGQRPRRISLPTYPFARHRYWIEPGEPLPAAREAPAAVERSAPAQTLHPRPVLSTSYAAPRSELEDRVAGLWREVLGLADLGVHDSFLELGGDSLLATRLMAKLREALGVELPMERLFHEPTVAALAAAVAEARAAMVDEVDRIPRQPRKPGGGGEFPVSYAQQRLWFLDRLEPGTPLYNLPSAIAAEGRLDVAALAASLREIVRRHEALRTTFAGRAEGPVQVIHPQVAFELPLVDLQALPPGAREAEAQRLATAEARRPFDLARGPLARALLLRLEAERHLAVLTLHHVVSDGWSMGVLVREIAALYPAFAAGSPSPLSEPAVQYADFAVWQRERLRGETLEREVAFWREALAGAPLVLDLPVDRPRPALQTFRGAQAPLRLEAELVAALREAGRTAGHTLFMSLLAAFEVLLGRWSGQDVLLVGSPVSGRARPEAQGLIGFFVNTLPLRGDLTGEPTLGELLGGVKEAELAAFAHQDLPFGRLVEELHPQRDLGRSPLFQVMFALQRAAAEALDLPGLTLRSRDLDTGTAKLDLTLQLAEGAESVAGWIEYNSDLFEAATAERMVAQLATLLRAFPGGLGRRVRDLPLLPEQERRQLLTDWNATRRRWPAETLVHELFERQAARTPAAPAVSYGGETLTYGQLDERANRLARRLRRWGVGPEDRVGLCVERSAEMVVALLGILKSGGAYVPLDPSHPAERLGMVLADSGMAVLVTEERLLAALPAHAARILCLDRDAAAIAAESAAPLARLAVEESLAYVIYTSGSTGRPKGVQLPHRALVNFLRAMAERPGLRPADVVPALTTLSFDIAGLEIYLPLAVGGRVEVVAREEAADGRRLAARLRESGATVVQATPATWRLLLASAWEGIAGLKILCGGEALPRDLAAALLPRGAELWNLYGPTESAVWSVTGRVPPGAGPVLLGRPIANTELYVADQNLREVPLGAPGELLIGGLGLARGYLGQAGLTAEKFVPHPWSGGPGARLYRTGDLVRYRSTGELEFLGRIDHQVKVRGFRIELGEIEAALLRHPRVAQAVVTARQEAAETRLVAYVVPAGEAPAIGDLREHLRRTLPETMIPSAFVTLDALPLNPSGKVDRKALPAPQGTRDAAAERSWVDPRSELERTVAAVWRDVLGIDRVGADDNFFDLGGHSLLAAQVHSRLGEVLGREIALLDLFRYPTVASLAAFLGGAAVATAATGLERAAARRQSARTAEAVAIVGMAGRFPGANGVDAFWENLKNGVESISFFSDEELRAAGVPDSALADRNYVRARGVVDGADEFDAGFFGYSPREAEVIDPQQRLFLECAWEAFEDAGHEPARFPGGVGVFAGAGMNTYVANFLADPEVLDSVGNFQLMIGNDKDFLAPRVSYKLGLKGPSISVQTACSTSLVAVHLACQSLLAGECDAALAGGVSLRLPQAMGYHYHEGAVFSPDGHCRAFDAAAAGFVGGNGAAVVLLRRLSDALRDGDPVRAVIRGSAVNNDGSFKVGFTAPSIDGQAQVIAQALAMAGVEPESIGYVEAHGTGTELGDPIEVAALRQAFGPRAPRGGCLLGSLKTNVGHLDSAAGVAGLIKAALALERRQIPPTLHLERPNPELRLEESPFRVADRLTDWAVGPAPRRAGVSSLGIGGTNAHVVLEEAPPSLASTPGREWKLLPLSARSDAALEKAVADLAAHFGRRPETELEDAAYTLQVGRRRFERRAVALCRDAADAAAVLAGTDPERLLLGGGEAASVAFLFSGQGAQHPGMAAEAYRGERTFRTELDRACEALRPLLGLDLRALLFPAAGAAEAAAESLARTEITQPALFAVEHALARQWMEWGIRPAAMLGHSIGEYVAACLAGVFSFEDALALVVERGRLMAAMAPGAMLAVSLPEAEVSSLLGAELSLAAANGPARTVVAGPEPAIAGLEAALAERGVRHRRLRTSHAFHSAMMEPVLAPFAERVRRVRLSPPAIPFLSNVTGTWITAAEATDPVYWARHLRSAVRFADGVAALAAEPERVLLEVGPGNSLATLAREAGAEAFASLPHPNDRRSDLAFLLTTLGRLWLTGVEVDWRAFHALERRRRVPLPTYPFERRRYWVQGGGPLGIGQGSAPRADLAKRPDPADWLYAPTWKRSLAAPLAAIAGPVLVLAGGSGLGESLLAALRASGQDAVAVRLDEGFRPGSREDHVALLLRLNREKRLPRTVLHLWSLEGDGSFEDAQERGFRSLVALAQAWGETGGGDPLDLLVVASGLCDVSGEEDLRPERATLLGPARVIPWEYRGVSCHVVDVVPPEPGSPAEAGLAALVLREAAPGETGERLVALRGGRRWVQAWEPLRLQGPAVEPPRVREDGVYLITGGLGGVGLELAAALARGRRVRLALLSRTALPQRSEWPARIAAAGEGDRLAGKLRRVQELEQAGAEVLTLAVDVTDRAALAAAIGEVRERFGPIHGAVHTAGIPGGGLIQRQAAAELERVLAPSVQGLLMLDELLAGEPLDFLVLTSAAGALSGEPGQVHLGAAGSFLDAFAQARARPGIGPFIAAIDWDTWREVGMAADLADLPADLRRAREEALATGITPTEGREVFSRVLERATLPQILVSTKDLGSVLAMLERRARGEEAGAATTSRTTYARPELRSGFVEPRDETERAISLIWQELLGLDRVGVNDNFFDLGGHSLLATQVMTRLRDSLGVDLPLDALFSAPSVAGLAAAAVRTPTEDAGTEELEALLREIEAMSAAEAEATYRDELSQVAGEQA
jgi:amino acid adenylation domain-containing protein